MNKVTVEVAPRQYPTEHRARLFEVADQIASLRSVKCVKVSTEREQLPEGIGFDVVLDYRIILDLAGSLPLSLGDVTLVVRFKDPNYVSYFTPDMSPEEIRKQRFPVEPNLQTSMRFNYESQLAAILKRLEVFLGSLANETQIMEKEVSQLRNPQQTA